MTRTVAHLQSATDLVLRALWIQLLWLLGTLAGGIVLGWAPATTAAFDAARRAARGEPIPLAAVARAWRTGFWRSQVSLGLPGLLILLACATTFLAQDVPFPLTLASGAAAIILLIVTLHIPVIDQRHDVPVSQVLGRAAALAAAQAPMSLLIGAFLVLWVGACSEVPGLVPFLGVAGPILLAQHLVGRSLDRNDRLLEEQASAAVG